MLFRLRLKLFDLWCWSIRVFRPVNAWVTKKIHGLGLVSDQDLIAAMIDPNDPDVIYDGYVPRYKPKVPGGEATVARIQRAENQPRPIRHHRNPVFTPNRAMEYTKKTAEEILNKMEEDGQNSKKS